jgi:WD40 repeat protein
MKQVVSGSQDGQIFVWNFKADSRPVRFLDHKGYVSATVFSNDGKTIASG